MSYYDDDEIEPDYDDDDRDEPTLGERVDALERRLPDVYQLKSQLDWISKQCDWIKSVQTQKSDYQKALETLIVRLIVRDHVHHNEFWPLFFGWLQGVDENSELTPGQKGVLREERLIVARALDRIEVLEREGGLEAGAPSPKP